MKKARWLTYLKVVHFVSNFALYALICNSFLCWYILLTSIVDTSNKAYPRIVLLVLVLPIRIKGKLLYIGTIDMIQPFSTEWFLIT